MSSRIDLIAPFLEKYHRPFSVLDIGAGNGSVVEKIGRRWPLSVITAIEKDATRENYEPLAGVMCLKHEFTAEELMRFSECEHFDIVLAFNIIHWYREKWPIALGAILSMGSHVFVQLPKREDKEACGQDIIQEIHDCLVDATLDKVGETIQFPGHMSRPVFHRFNPISRLKRTGMGAEEGSADTLIIANEEVKYANFRKKKMTKEWVEGLNLWNFCGLGGIVPTKERIVGMLRSFPLPPKTHGDVVPHNFILQREAVTLVDGFEGWEFDDREGLEKTIKRVEDVLI